MKPSRSISLTEIKSFLAAHSTTKHIKIKSQEQARFLYAHMRQMHLLETYFPKMNDKDRIRKSANTVGWNLPKIISK